MYTVDGTTIRLTRGNSFVLAIELKQGAELYTPTGNDVVTFEVKHKDMTPQKKRYTDYNPLILKTIPNDTMLLTLVPDDTKNMDFGEYAYDMTLTFADGKVDTFIEGAQFIITPKV